MKIKEYLEYLEDNGACGEAIEWSKDYKTLGECWDNCKRADWLMWLCGKSLERKIVVGLACDCAETSLKYVPDGEDRPRLCIETTRKWVEGDATIEEVRESRMGAYAYAYAYAAYAADAAYAYAYAAYAAAADADAVDAATAAAATAATAASARHNHNIKLCKMIREKVNITSILKGI